MIIKKSGAAYEKISELVGDKKLQREVRRNKENIEKR